MRSLIIFLFAIAFNTLIAQSIERQVISSTGGYYSNGGYSLSYTVGEAVTTTLSTAGYILTQGFQQPGDDTVLNNFLYVRVYLQGPYLSNGNMNNALAGSGYIPNSQPYNTSPWNYTGTETYSSIPTNAVDWVIAELRSTPDTIVARRAALLLSDGSIIDTNGTPGLVFNNLQAGMYYLVIDHKNHMPVMTSTPVQVPSPGWYDLSDTLNRPLYGGADGSIALEAGISGLIAGDINKDNLLKYSGPGNDRSLILQRIVGVSGSTSITTTIDGYYPEDANLNGQLKYSGPGNDPSKIIQNLVLLSGSNAITTVFICPVPAAVVK